MRSQSAPAPPPDHAPVRSPRPFAGHIANVVLTTLRWSGCFVGQIAPTGSFNPSIQVAELVDLVPVQAEVHDLDHFGSISIPCREVHELPRPRLSRSQPIVVAEIEQDATLAGAMMLRKALQHAASEVDVVAAARVN